ncbi:dimethylaniline monooxygenase [Tothia fuscella]|uniref:Dimethylaniline monooxygenase n=1 Tax=Tothia fuscella TaxID=1048955 RepID=A0A9P4TYP2_9PEZI|nr:dimethylaniline monooxygenase [Tothia fuscella]
MGSNRNITQVAVIGAGISGVLTAAYLKNAGVHVTVFERAKVAGGVWVYDERVPIDPTYPAIKPSKGEAYEEFDAKGKSDLRELLHAPPSPVYYGLKNNIATSLMQTKQLGWPDGTLDFVTHAVFKNYIQEISSKTGVQSLTKYGARVSAVKKEGLKWSLTYTVLGKDLNEPSQQYELFFDAVIVAAGHYHCPRVPDIPGLTTWKAKWPSRIWHSKAYRKPDQFKGKNILLIGAGTSSTDIARELHPVANKIYQSSRNSKYDFPIGMLPPNATRIAEIASFDLAGLEDANDETFPATITLKSGEKLCDIHNIIICTGYTITFSYLNSYHNDDLKPTEADDTILVTDGSQVHNLHKDIWYIPDPSLAFVGIPYFTANFSLFEFQAIAVAAVLSGAAILPAEEVMRKEYAEKVALKGVGRSFHSLRGEEVQYVNELLEWINTDPTRSPAEKIEGHTALWHQANEAQNVRIREAFDPTNNWHTGFPLTSCL